MPRKEPKHAEPQKALALKPSNPKFVPHDNIPPAATPSPVVPGGVPDGASILIIQQPWLGLILDGRKTLEIRGKICKKKRGERIYLALSGGGGVILGSAEFTGCAGPLSQKDYVARAQAHCVAGGTLPYGSSTYAWGVRAPQRFSEPVPYRHKQGCVVWATMESDPAELAASAPGSDTMVAQVA